MVPILVSMSSQPIQAAQIFEPVDSRRSRRYLMGGSIACNMGKIINLSTEGALIVSRMTYMTGSVPLSIGDGSTQLCCIAQIVRTRRVSSARHVCAVSFAELSSEQADAVKRLIATHRIASDVRAFREAA